jgi:hypothetical protein
MTEQFLRQHIFRSQVNCMLNIKPQPPAGVKHGRLWLGVLWVAAKAVARF